MGHKGRSIEHYDRSIEWQNIYKYIYLECQDRFMEYKDMSIKYENISMQHNEKSMDVKENL